jgi:hypothetical protein
MKKDLDKVLVSIGETFGGQICASGRNYLELDLGKLAETLGCESLKKKYDKVNVIIPLQKPVRGMKVRIDGRTFINYAQFQSGIAVPGYVASDAGLPYKSFVPNDSMILNF